MAPAGRNGAVIRKKKAHDDGCIASDGAIASLGAEAAFPHLHSDGPPVECPARQLESLCTISLRPEKFVLLDEILKKMC